MELSLASPLTQEGMNVHTQTNNTDYVCSELRCNEATVECIANTVDKTVLRNHSEA